MNIVVSAGLCRAVGLCVALAISGCEAGAAMRAEQCGRLGGPGQIGPFDYRNDRAALPVIEQHHFTPRVEALLGGVTGPIGADLDYTLQRVPNHHRALIALMRLSERDKTRHVPHMTWEVECYFERALRFRSNDVVARMLYSQFLTRDGRRPEALAELARAAADGADHPFSQYNVGLLYLEMKEYELALEQAHKAMALGMGRTELADGLKAAGQWRDIPVPLAAPASAAASDR